jgi:hypothetical protein
MLHRIVSRSVFAFAAAGLLASCEDNTTGTPLTPPPPSTAVYVNPVLPDGGFGFEQVVIERPNGPDTSVVITDTTVVADTTVVGIDTTIVVDTTFSGDTTIVTDTTVTIVTPDPVFEAVFPDGQPAVGQTITFNVNLPGFIEQTTDVVDAAGFATPGRWVVAEVCPNPDAPPPFCRVTQRVIATPVAGNTGFIDVEPVFPPPPPPDLRNLKRR